MAGREEARRRGGPGLVVSLLGAGLLLVVGFVVGLAVGASWEDPDLLVSAMSGAAQEVVLEQTAAGSGEQDVERAAPAPLGSRAVAGSVTVPSVNAPPPSAPQPAAAVGGFSVQVGAFQDRDPARDLSSRLEKKGFRAYLAQADGTGTHRWRVRVGPVGSRSEADRLAARLKRDQGLPTWVVQDER